MIDALVDDGDVVIVKPGLEAANGDMVVAWLKQEEEATLKKFYLEGDRVRLQPANSQMDPFIVRQITWKSTKSCCGDSKAGLSRRYWLTV